MKVEFYGHVRQYHNIKSEIDKNIQTVLESGQYVMGPMLKKFEGELAAYHVAAGAEPAGSQKLTFRLGLPATAADPSLAPLEKFLAGRFPIEARATLVAQPVAGTAAPPPSAVPAKSGLPLVHILISNSWDHLTDGLDGIAIDLPALNVKATHGAYFPLNIQVRDPIWPLRK